MATTTFTPAKTGNTRVFLIEGGARVDHTPSYQFCIRMLGVSQGFGDVEGIEQPNPDEYGKFVQISETKGATERATTSLEGRYAMDLRSELLRLARKGCSIDVQLHMGKCTNPSEFNTFEKIIVLEGAIVTNYGTEDLGALASGDNTVINETADISAKDLYELLPVTWGVKGGSTVVNEVMDVTLCDTPSCGECTTVSDGCQRIYAVTKAAGGSPATIPDVVFSLDKGITWYAHDIDGMTDAQRITCVGTYVVVCDVTSTGKFAYCPKADLNEYTDPTWTVVTTGIHAGGSPIDLFGVGYDCFVVGKGGHIYYSADITTGVTCVDDASATVDDLNRVQAISSTFAVAVGNNGAVVYTEDGTSWKATTRKPCGYGKHLTALWVFDKNNWLVGVNDGTMFFTSNAGVTWSAKTFPGSGTGKVMDFFFSTPTAGWLCHQTAATKGRVLRSFDGGHSWKVTPELSGTIPAADNYNAIAGCSQDPNFGCAVGLGDDAADGIIIVGQAAGSA